MTAIIKTKDEILELVEKGTVIRREGQFNNRHSSTNFTYEMFEHSGKIIKNFIPKIIFNGWYWDSWMVTEFDESSLYYIENYYRMPK